MPRYQQVVRQWKLLRRLEQTPGGVTVAEFTSDQDSSKRNIYRDLEALQEAGFPLYQDPIDGQHRWRLTDNFRKGGLPIQLSEILSLRCARSALESLDGTPFYDGLHALILKIDSLLSPSMRDFARQMDEVFVGDRFGRPDYTDLKPFIETINEAASKAQSIDILYHPQKGEPSRRRVDPYNLWIHRSVLYLIAWCHLRHDIRTFALSRIKELEPTHELFTPQADYDFNTYARRRFRIMSEGEICTVRIWFAPEAALYVSERTWHPSQQITPAEGGGIELTMEVDGLAEVSTWIMSFGPRAKVLGPEGLVKRVREELGGALGRYREEK